MPSRPRYARQPHSPSSILLPAAVELELVKLQARYLKALSKVAAITAHTVSTISTMAELAHLLRALPSTIVPEARTVHKVRGTSYTGVPTATATATVTHPPASNYAIAQKCEAVRFLGTGKRY